MPFSKSRIDKMGDVLRDGVYEADMLVALNEFRSEFLESYESVVYTLRSKLHFDVTGRPAKSTSALIDKLRRESARLSQIQDIAGCRVVVEDIPAQNRALDAIEVFLTKVVVYDRREKPSNGYRAVHIVTVNEPRKVEVQLRTALQHLWAEISEKFADTVDPNIKYGRGDDKHLRLLNSLSESIARIEADEMVRYQFRARVAAGGKFVSPKLKKQIRDIERRFQAQRSRFLQLLLNLQKSFEG